MKKFAMWMPTAGLTVTIAIIVCGIVDLVHVLVSGTGTSISDFLIKSGFKDPVIIFTFGFVMGHLFGGMRPKEIDDKGNFVEPNK